MNKRIILNHGMIDCIHVNQDSTGPEMFAVTINAYSKQKVKELQSQILEENNAHPKLVQIKERLECVIKENQDTQKSTKNKLDEMDDIQMKDESAEIDNHQYDVLEDLLGELAADEQQLLSILNGVSQN